MQRNDGRSFDQLRPVEFVFGVQRHAEGSVLIKMGDTHVLCSASVEPGVPGWMKGRGQGWITAEYSLLPRATNTRTRRERGSIGGRTQEIQRLIGRSLRMTIDLKRLGERTITLDCDVIQADGGTRTASITGAYVALEMAIDALQRSGDLKATPLVAQIAAVSVGVIGGRPMLDLNYEEDSKADVDLNIVQTDTGAFVEVQGTAEAQPFDRSALDQLLDLGSAGIRQLVASQQAAIERIRKTR